MVSLMCPPSVLTAVVTLAASSVFLLYLRKMAAELGHCDIKILATIREWMENPNAVNRIVTQPNQVQVLVSIGNVARPSSSMELNPHLKQFIYCSVLLSINFDKVLALLS